MSDAPGWAAVGVSCVALAWTAWVDRRTRVEAKTAAAQREQAAIDGAIARVVAQWGATRLKEVTWFLDSNLDELKQSALRWREGCREPLAILPQNSRAHELVTETVRAVSAFEGVIDPMREGKSPVDGTAGQEAMTRLQTAFGTL